jgi:hypothetical protein
MEDPTRIPDSAGGPHNAERPSCWADDGTATDECVDRIAREFHERYERLAPDFGYKTRDASAVPWDQVPEANANLMRGVVRSLLEDGVIAP